MRGSKLKFGLWVEDAEVKELSAGWFSGRMDRRWVTQLFPRSYPVHLVSVGFGWRVVGSCTQWLLIVACLLGLNQLCMEESTHSETRTSCYFRTIRNRFAAAAPSCIHIQCKQWRVCRETPLLFTLTDKQFPCTLQCFTSELWYSRF